MFVELSVVTDPIKVLCVCTHNRTRSVLTAGLLQQHLTELGLTAITSSAGTVAGGHPATDRTVRMLAERSIDVSGHRSQTLTAEIVAAADLILTAERDHVASIVGRWPAAFGRTVTLPEAVDLSQLAGQRGGMAIRDWVARMEATGRDPLEYLSGHVGEIEDPTGRSPAVWSRVFSQIDDLTRSLAKAML